MMDRYTMVNGMIIKYQDSEFIRGQTAEGMKVNGLIILCMGKANILGWTAETIQEIITWIKKKDMEKNHMLMEIFMK